MIEIKSKLIDENTSKILIYNDETDSFLIVDSDVRSFARNSIFMGINLKDDDLISFDNEFEFNSYSDRIQNQTRRRIITSPEFVKLFDYLKSNINDYEDEVNIIDWNENRNSTNRPLTIMFQKDGSLIDTIRIDLYENEDVSFYSKKEEALEVFDKSYKQIFETK